MLIATVVGNRPQFVKAAAVSTKLREVAQEVLVHTGQHHDDELSRIFFDELGIPAPDRQPGCSTHSIRVILRPEKASSWTLHPMEAS